MQRRHNIKQIANHRDVGDLEDRRLGVLVDGDDAARAFHSNDVLDRTADTQRQIQLGRDASVRDEPTWRSIGSQPASQIGREAASSPPSASAKLLGHFDVLLLLDAAPNRNDDLRPG